MNTIQKNRPTQGAGKNPSRQVIDFLYRLAVWIGLALIGLVWLIMFQNMRDDYIRLYYSPKAAQETGLLGLPSFTWLVIVQIQQYLILLISLFISSLVYWVGIIRSGRRDWTAWLFSLTLVILALTPLGEPGLSLSELEKLLHLLQSNLAGLATVMFVNIFFIFPNGRFVRRWIGWAALGFNLSVIVLFFLQAIVERTNNWGAAAVLGSYAWILIVFLFVGAGFLAFISQIYRYHFVSTALEKQQTKWVIASLGFIPIFLIVGLFLSFLGIENRSPGFFEFWNLLFDFLLATVLPISVAFAILRYHLWDVDLILRRTLVYSLLTSFLALLYYGSVTLLQSVFLTLSGQSSPAALVISTLVIAGLFNPLRHRIQDFIDQRFYRRKYDAERALAQFAAAARSETNLNALTDRLTGTVQETLQPERIMIWMRHIGLEKEEVD